MKYKSFYITILVSKVFILDIDGWIKVMRLMLMMKDPACNYFCTGIFTSLLRRKIRGVKLAQTASIRSRNGPMIFSSCFWTGIRIGELIFILLRFWNFKPRRILIVNHILATSLNRFIQISLRHDHVLAYFFMNI